MTQPDVNSPADAVAEHEAPADDEMEEFVGKNMARAASLTGAKIDRGVFLRTELKKRYPEIDADLAVESTPLEAGDSRPISTLWRSM